MTLSAWRPLKDAPRDKPVVVDDMGILVVGHWSERQGWLFSDSGGCGPLNGDEPFIPIADTLELDRAVQSEIARAFGEFISGVKSATRPTNQYAEVDAYNAFVRVRTILHTALGGRIPEGSQG